ncbi:MAG: prepilin-type N-terminal cleavage/methylation domain-containing protein [Elusimicrobia bacterium]|nr:prepilin-type N-terminal cleavage/methylation domain-containing protein [Elusimicrobiota bacterium]
MNERSRRPSRTRAGFTLIELIVTVLMIGILSAIAIPQYFKLVEKGRVSEALSLLDAARASQERYRSKYGSYCTTTITSCGGLDLAVPTLKYFNTPTAFLAGSAPPSWKVTLTRNTNVGVYGNYVLTFDVESTAAPLLTCNQTNCSAELLPR